MSSIYPHHVKESLADLADERYQRKVWLGESDLVGSLEEAHCHLFDDSGLGHSLDRDELVFSEVLDEQLRSLDKLLSKVDTVDQSVADLLDSEQLVEVRQMSARLLFDLVRHEAEASHSDNA